MSPVFGLRRHALVAQLLAAFTGAGLASGHAEPVDVSVCRIIDASARDHGLPTAFLTRLVWQESSFRHDAISPAGAQGIAQFMPGTARERGLSDPFDPAQAIPKAASLLADFRRRFGSLGLAAAAYNAGPVRVSAWLAGQGTLPAETESYVLGITGQPARTWMDAKPPLEGGDASCSSVLADLRLSQPARAAVSALLAPWGVQLSGAFSRDAALAAYRRQQRLYAQVLGDLQPMIIGGHKPGRGFRPFFQIRAPAPSRAAAAVLCTTILRAGGACSVLRS